MVRCIALETVKNIFFGKKKKKMEIEFTDFEKKKISSILLIGQCLNF